jgi:uncharacterized membrane protein
VSDSVGPKQGGAGSLRPERFFWLSVLFAVVYSVLWTWLSLLRVYALRASVYDLGVFAQEGWRTYSIHYTAGSFLVALLNQGGGLYLFPVVWGGYPLIVGFQSFALGAGAVFAYLIARRLALSPPKALALAAAYLLYFPLTGVNWDDVHYEAFLIPLFLLGIWLFLRGNYRWSFVAIALIAPLQFPLAGFPLLFSVQLLIPLGTGWALSRWRPSVPADATGPAAQSRLRRFLEVVRNWQFRGGGDGVPTWYVLGLFVFSGAVLAGGFLTNRLFYPENGVVTLAHATSVSVSLNLPLKLFTLVLLLAPLAFLPALSPRWLQLCAPFFALTLFVNYYGYVYPGIATSWYPCLVLPFLTLAAIDGLAKVEASQSWPQLLWHRVRTRWGARRTTRERRPAPAASPAPRRWRTVARTGNLAVIAMLVAVGVSASFLAPYGVWNSATAANFDIGGVVGYNATLWDHFARLASLIPRSEPAVILQDNMPTLLPRPLPPGDQSPLVAGDADVVAYNLTWKSPAGVWTPIDPAYVIGNPTPLLYSFFNASGPYPYNTSMQDILENLYLSGQYGVLGEADGMMVLEHGYTGPLQYYVPLVEQFSPEEFSTASGSHNAPQCTGPCVLVSNQTKGQVSWYGPYSYLSPGKYSVTFHVALLNWNAIDNVTLEVSANYGFTRLGQVNLAGPLAGAPLTSESISVPINVAIGLPAIEFRAIGSHFVGSLILYGVTVSQTAAPPTVF